MVCFSRTWQLAWSLFRILCSLVSSGWSDHPLLSISYFKHFLVCLGDELFYFHWMLLWNNYCYPYGVQGVLTITWNVASAIYSNILHIYIQTENIFWREDTLTGVKIWTCLASKHWCKSMNFAYYQLINWFLSESIFKARKERCSLCSRAGHVFSSGLVFYWKTLQNINVYTSIYAN